MSDAEDALGKAVAPDIAYLEVPIACAGCMIYIFVGLAIHNYQETYHHMPWIHESAVVCIVGVIMGAIIKTWTGVTVDFDNNVFFYLVLPPIIFAAGYTMKRRNFFKYMDLIAFFGIVGTFMNFFLIAGAAYGYGRWWHWHGGFRLNVYEALIFSAVLTGSDEVSARSLVRIKDFPRMGALIFGEGVMNDALSIVLFKTFEPMYNTEYYDQHHGIVDPDAPPTDDIDQLPDTLLEGAGGGGGGGGGGHGGGGGDDSINLVTVITSMGTQILCSVLIGVGCALVHARLMKVLPRIRHFPVYQTALVMLFGYFAYCIAEAAGISGILTVFVAAFSLAHYAWYNLSSSAQITTRMAFSAISEIAEGFAFSYVGLSLWTYEGDEMNILFSVYMLVCVIGARLLTTLSLFYLCSFCLPSFRVPVSEQLGFMLGGVVRGCLSWAQILQVKHSPVLITSTLFIVMTTSLGSGVLLPILLPMLTPAPEVAKRLLVDDAVTAAVLTAVNTDPVTGITASSNEAAAATTTTTSSSSTTTTTTGGGSGGMPAARRGVARATSSGAGQLHFESEPFSLDVAQQPGPEGPEGAGSTRPRRRSSITSVATAAAAKLQRRVSRRNSVELALDDGEYDDDEDEEEDGDYLMNDLRTNEELINLISGSGSGSGSSSSPHAADRAPPPSLAAMLFYQWVRFDETFMKPMFGGSDRRHQLIRARSSSRKRQEQLWLQQQQQQQQQSMTAPTAASGSSSSSSSSYGSTGTTPFSAVAASTPATATATATAGGTEHPPASASTARPRLERRVASGQLHFGSDQGTELEKMAEDICELEHVLEEETASTKIASANDGDSNNV